MSDEPGVPERNGQQQRLADITRQQMQGAVPTGPVPRDAMAAAMSQTNGNVAGGNSSAANVTSVEVAGGTFGTATFGPTSMSATRNVGIAGGDYRGAHFGPSYHSTYLVDNPSGQSPGSQQRPPCEKHPGKNCSKLTDSICLFSNEKLSTAPKSKVYAGAKTSGLLPDELLGIKLIQGFSEKNEREARNLVKLRPHQNVVTIYQADACTQGPVRCMFIAMERCSKVNLESYIKNRRAKKVPFNVKQAFEYSRQIIGAIHHIHASGILHRDLKPSSVLFSLCGRFLKICDFGVSKELKFGHSVMSLSMLKLGTDGYRAPETYNKNSITKMADIFSLALVLYHLMSYGYHPFGLDTEEWNLNIKKGRYCVMTRLRVPFLDVAKDFITKMLEFEPVNRPKIEAVAGDFAKLDWLSPLSKHIEEVWSGTIKDTTGADVLPCQLYCSPNVKETVEIDGMEWNFQMNTVNFLNFGALKKVTDEEPSGYIVTSSKEEVKKLIEKLTKNKLMAWISISKPGRGEKVLVLLCYPEYPELFGFFLPTREIVSSSIDKLVSKQSKEEDRRGPDQGLPNAPMDVPLQGQQAPVAETIPVPMDPMEGSDIVEQVMTEPEEENEPEDQQSVPAARQERRPLTTNKEFIPWWIIRGD